LNPDSRGRAGLRSRAPTPARPQSARTGRKHTHEFTDPRNRAGYLHAPLSHMMQNACVRARACSTHGHAGNTSDSATAHGRTTPAIEGAATQATRHTCNAYRDRQHDSIRQLCVCPSGKRSEGVCCEAMTDSAQNGQGVRRGDIAVRPRHVPFSGGVVKGKLFVDSNSLPRDKG